MIGREKEEDRMKERKKRGEKVKGEKEGHEQKMKGKDKEQ